MNRRRYLTSDDMLDSAGTYFNPVTEVVVTVDDTNYIDLSQVNLDEYSGKEWVLISEEPLNDSSAIAESLQTEIELEGGPLGTNNLSDTAEEQQG